MNASKAIEDSVHRCFGSSLWSSLYFAASCGEAHLLIIMISIENQEMPGYLKLRGLYLRPEGRSFTPQLGNSRHNTARSPDRFSGTGHGISPAAPTSFVFPILGVLESLLRPLNTSLFYLTSLESVLTLFIATLLNCPPVTIVLDTKFPTLPSLPSTKTTILSL